LPKGAFGRDASGVFGSAWTLLKDKQILDELGDLWQRAMVRLEE